MRGLRSHLPELVFGCVLLLAAAVLAHHGRDTTFYFDDWNFVVDRIGWSAEDLLAPHNEHLSLIPVLIYKCLHATAGLDHYEVYRGVLIALVLVIGTLLYVFARRRVGPWPATALAASAMVMGPAYIDLIWAFQVGFAVSLVCVLGVLLALERGGGRRTDALVSLLMVVALASSSIGLPLVAAVLVHIVLGPDRWRRIWVVLVPLVLYGLWYIEYGVSGDAKLSNAPEIPGWIASALGGATGAVSGFGPTYGIVLATVLVYFVVRELVRVERVPVMLLTLLALPVSFWAATALARAGTTTTPVDERYLLPGGIFVGLVAVEIARGHLTVPRVAVAVGLVLGAGAAINAAAFESGRAALVSEADKVRGALTAVELVGPEKVPGEMLPVPTQPQLIAGRYAAARKKYDSTPAWPLATLASAPAGIRTVFDTTLRQLQAPTLDAGRGRACRPATPPAPGGDADVVIPPGGLAIRAGDQPVEVRVRRYGPGFTDPAIGTVAPDETAVLRLPPDDAELPWRAGLRSGGTIETCTPR